jgi:pyruvate/2-oxoglutarate dehydrogenase complex dihydrolipoamide acyltransferase (E2) component
MFATKNGMSKRYISTTKQNKEVCMDAKKRPDAVRAQSQGARTIQSRMTEAEQELKKLDNVPIDNASPLVKYRQNITVPAIWLGDQQVRLQNVPMIPAEKISDLTKYIKDNTKIIDGGNLDVFS